jgi:hypothetical protein
MIVVVDICSSIATIQMMVASRPSSSPSAFASTTQILIKKRKRKRKQRRSSTAARLDVRSFFNSGRGVCKGGNDGGGGGGKKVDSAYIRLRCCNNSTKTSVDDRSLSESKSLRNKYSS